MAENPGRRSSFLEERCSDAGVRAEVERLLAEHEAAGSFLSKPVLDGMTVSAEETIAFSRKIDEGMLLAGRFRIIRFIAAGGMGEVYEAQDEELRERVAIKTIRAEILRQPNTMARFRREVHLSRKVTHPNVCRIFDLFRHKPEGGGDEIAFISMELLHGETLGNRLKSEEVLNGEQALPLIRQMGSALAAAHAVGVVHRDFKPQNVVLVPGPDAQRQRAVVTDFGLALQAESPGETVSLSTGPALVGTPAYMSPEQLEGRAATPASDIYALGLVIYEMVTGGRPFQGDTPMSAALKRISETPLPPRKLKPGISAAWESAILRCLERDPAKRFQDAEDVARALAGEAATPSTRGVARRINWRKVAIASAALLIVIVGVGYGFRRWAGGNEAKARVSLRPSVAVLGFKNLSARPDEDWLSMALSDLLTTELAAGEQVRTIPGENLTQMKLSLGLKDADGYGRDTLSRIQRAIEADKVLVGSYLALGRETGGKIHLDLKLQDVNAGETVAAIVEDGTEDQLPELVSRTCAALLERLGMRALTAGEKNELEASVSTTPEANRLYAEGLTKLRTFDALGAKDLLSKAVQTDDSFALAHSALSQVWSRLGYDAKAREEAKRALDLSAGLPREERLVIESRYRSALRDWPNAIELAKTLHTFFPDSLEYGLLLAGVQDSGGKTADALATIEELRKLPAALSDDPRIDLKEADIDGSMGDGHKKLAAAQKAEQKAKAKGMSLIEASARFTVGGALYDLGQTKQALAAYQEALQTYQRLGDSKQVGNAYYNSCEAFEDLGEFAEARKAGEQGLEIFRGIGDVNGQALILNEIAIILRHTGDFTGAIMKADESYALKKQVDDKHGMIAARGNRANVLEDMGDLRGALETYEEILKLSQEIGNKRFEAITLGNIANVRREVGEVSEALQQIQEALAMSGQIGNKFSHVWQLGTLATLEMDSGDLGAAEKAADDALALARSADENPYVAMALVLHGQIAFERGDLTTARQRYEEASSSYQKAGDKNAQAQVSYSLADVLVEQGNLEEAEKFGRQAVEELDKEKAQTAALAHASLAGVLLAEGKVQEAQREGTRAKQLALKSQNLSIALPVQIVSAQVEARTRPGVAASQLQKIIRECERLHYVDSELEGRLTLGEIQTISDKKASAATLASVRKDAEAKGFLRVARKAAAAMKNGA